MSHLVLNQRRRTGWRGPRAVPLPLRILTGLATLAVVGALVFSAATAHPEPAIRLAAGPGTTISILNSKEGLAVLSAANMRPGDSAAGSVTITNTGDGDGAFSLSSSALSDVPGAGAGVLSGELDLTVVDNTVPSSPVTVYSGKLDALGPTPLGTFSAGEARTYDFTVSFPNGALGAENAYQGAATSLTLDWDAVLSGGTPAPAVASATPPDGSTLASAGAAALTTNVPVAAVQGPTLDGSPVGVSISATQVDFSTGALSPGPHTIAGVLQSLDGQTTPFRLHFTVWSTPVADYPYVEMNSPPGEDIALTATNGGAVLSAPANAWSGGAADDWVVFRLDPAPAPSSTGGLAGTSNLYAVSAYWALAASPVTSFDKAIDVRIAAGSGLVIPAAYASGAWRRLVEIPGGTTLPGTWADGYYVSGSQVHLLTRESGSFGLLRDVQAPSKPAHFSRKYSRGHVVLKWRAATDNEGVKNYLVYRGGKVLKKLGKSARSYDIGRVKPTERRAFTVAARDAAGNRGPKARSLVAVPPLRNLTLTRAKKALRSRGLKLGSTSRSYSPTVRRGHVVRASRTGVVRKGSRVGLTISNGPGPQRAGAAAGSGPSGADASGGTGEVFYAPVPASTPRPSTSSASGSWSRAGSTLPPSNPSAESATTSPGSSASEPGTAEASRQRYTSGKPLDRRRAAGIALVIGAFIGAAVFALRARRGAGRRLAVDSAGTGPLVFWDERLARAAASALRRLAGSSGSRRLLRPRSRSRPR